MFKTSEVDLIFKKYLTKLTNSVRDDSKQGRVNEFFRVVTSQTHSGVVELIEKVVDGQNINASQIDYVINQLNDSVLELSKLKNILGGNNNVCNIRSGFSF